MIYDSKITQHICDELEKVPNIRYVCNKVGIDHSTFYRWMAKHHTFYLQVTDALVMGRQRMNDAAEGVIITGIQNNDFRSATYFLQHHDQRYANMDRIPYLQHVDKVALETLKETTPPDSQFELMFNYYFLLDDIYGKKKARKMIELFVKLMCHYDPALEKIFYISYEEWKNDKNELERKTEAARSKPSKDSNP